MTETTPPLLNEDQHRALSARLSMLEHQLAEAEIFISGVYPKGEMYEIIQDISPAQSEELTALFKQARERIGRLRDEFGLQVEKISIVQKLAGSFSILWTILEDTHAEKLKGFGAIAPQLPRRLDPQVDDIIDLFNRIKSLVAVDNT